MKRHTIDPDVLAQLRVKVTAQECPQCHAVGSLEIVERYDMTRPDPPITNARLEFGPTGMPLWAWCLACGSHGRVAKGSQGFPS